MEPRRRRRKNRAGRADFSGASSRLRAAAGCGPWAETYNRTRAETSGPPPSRPFHRARIQCSRRQSPTARAAHEKSAASGSHRIGRKAGTLQGKGPAEGVQQGGQNPVQRWSGPERRPGPVCVFVSCFPPAVSGSPGAHSRWVVTPGLYAAFWGCCACSSSPLRFDPYGRTVHAALPPYKPGLLP